MQSTKIKGVQNFDVIKSMSRRLVHPLEIDPAYQKTYVDINEFD